MTWCRSSKCDTSACTEVAFVGDHVLVRDSKNPDGPVLRFSVAEWAAFIYGAKDGEFDVPK